MGDIFDIRGWVEGFNLSNSDWQSLPQSLNPWHVCQPNYSSKPLKTALPLRQMGRRASKLQSLRVQPSQEWVIWGQGTCLATRVIYYYKYIEAPSPDPKLYFLGAWTLRELPAGLAPEFEGWLQQGPRPVEWGLGF